jgi:shikimate kinase
VIVLVGFMGAGKTTVGNLLAVRLGLPFADSDQVIEDCTGRPIRQDLRQGRRARVPCPRAPGHRGAPSSPPAL